MDVEDTVTPDKRFDEVITTESELRNIVGRANRWFTSKILNRLDRRCRDFIASSPFIVVGSTDPLGMVDLAEGRSRRIRKMSRRRDACHSAATGGSIRSTMCCRTPASVWSSLFPASARRCASWAPAVIVRDQDIRSARVPELAMIVIVERAFFHCGKCVTRAKLGIMGGIGSGLMHCPQSLRRHELIAPTAANCGGYHWTTAC